MIKLIATVGWLMPAPPAYGPSVHQDNFIIQEPGEPTKRATIDSQGNVFIQPLYPDPDWLNKWYNQIQMWPPEEEDETDFRD